MSEFGTVIVIVGQHRGDPLLAQPREPTRLVSFPLVKTRLTPDSEKDVFWVTD